MELTLKASCQGPCVASRRCTKPDQELNFSFPGELAEDAQLYGWNLTKNSHDWDRMVGNIQNHIKAQNWKIRVDLREKNVTYYNEYATFVDKHTVKVCLLTSHSEYGVRFFAAETLAFRSEDKLLFKE